MADIIEGLFVNGMCVGVNYDQYAIELFVPNTDLVDSILCIKEFEKHCLIGFALIMSFPISSININSATCLFIPVSNVVKKYDGTGENEIYSFTENAQRYKASSFFTETQFNTIVKEAFSKFKFKPIGVNGEDFCIRKYDNTVLNEIANKMLLL